MAVIRVSRRIAADPTSTALLLASPTGAACWVSSRGYRLATVRVCPPLRTTEAFVSRVELSGADVPDASGVLSVRHPLAGVRDGVTTAELRVQYAGTRGGRRADGAAALRALAGEFLAGLADAAEERAFAA